MKLKIPTAGGNPGSYNEGVPTMVCTFSRAVANTRGSCSPHQGGIIGGSLKASSSASVVVQSLGPNRKGARGFRTGEVVLWERAKALGLTARRRDAQSAASSPAISTSSST